MKEQSRLSSLTIADAKLHEALEGKVAVGLPELLRYVREVTAAIGDLWPAPADTAPAAPGVLKWRIGQRVWTPDGYGVIEDIRPVDSGNLHPYGVRRERDARLDYWLESVLRDTPPAPDAPEPDPAWVPRVGEPVWWDVAETPGWLLLFSGPVEGLFHAVDFRGRWWEPALTALRPYAPAPPPADPDWRGLLAEVHWEPEPGDCRCLACRNAWWHSKADRLLEYVEERAAAQGEGAGDEHE